MKIFFIAIGFVFISGCANSFIHAQNREDAVEVEVDGRVIRVIDQGNKVEMIRKGYMQTGSTLRHWEDYAIAAKEVTGCNITNIVNKIGTENYVWVEALKDCD
ncbi:MAG: hypothetical protein Tp1111SUR522732_44 [Prokaryotic dsDNA virus sp.]|uniref:hypothetical protein n=1 Tax=Methylophaga sp. UBA2689 TaxID=1946878 RepID=UPI00118A409E|nr:hypothetical protein [Methylophaga sp. UBA2689]QDP47106.1 MAG: hypothetical protein Tp1111SUR522732_44 [Prokaryotic dsDNA virus sp.]|tara:strand:- start:4366 stop:4674 length:309 start_codon:yes stop_codon:yes gene_type:complete